MNPSTDITPYLFFGGRCHEALSFYESALGAKVEMIATFDQSQVSHPDHPLPEGWEKKVMHATLRIGSSTVFVSDGNKPCELSGFMLHLPVKDQAEGDRVFAALSAQGEVIMPMEKTFWSPYYGMLVDKFGLGWMISVYDFPTEG